MDRIIPLLKHKNFLTGDFHNFMIKILYHSETSDEMIQPETLAQILQDTKGIFWIDITNPSSIDIEVLHEVFAFHPLTIEDIQNQEQRPKVEEFTDYLFMIVNPVAFSGGIITPRELDVFVGKHYMVTVHRDDEPFIHEARTRIQPERHPFEISVTYLLYLILDTIMDSYLPILEHMEQDIDELGNQLLSSPKPEMQAQLLELKRNVNTLWWIILPKKDILNTLTGHHLVFIDEKSKYYLRDVDDHLNRIMTMIQINRDNVSSLINLYVSSVSNQLNESVSRLTIFTIIVGTLAVMSGFYGMNFEHTWPPFDAVWGIPVVMVLMLLMMIAVYIFIRRIR